MTRTQPLQPGLPDGITTLDVLQMRKLDAPSRALAIGRRLAKPLTDADEDMRYSQRLRFWVNLLAYLLGVAENSLDADGREVIVQTLRNVPASDALRQARGNLQ